MRGGPLTLILGGTTEGYALAQTLTDAGCPVISSLAGRTANPRLPVGDVRIGGFGGIEGLHNYLTENRIEAVIDATHPFASRMGWNAQAACQQAMIPLLRLERPAWEARDGDQWEPVQTWEQAVEAVRRQSRRVLMTIGRQELQHFTPLADTWFLIRSVDAPNPMPPFAQAHVVLARGPFRLEDERTLLTTHAIDTIVCKNSGGSATDAKLTAARDLGIRVVILQRPPRPPTERVASTVEAVTWIQGLGRNNQGP